MTDMQIDIAGQSVRLIGDDTILARAVLEAVSANGGSVIDGGTPDLLVVSLPLLPSETIAVAPALEEAVTLAAAMAARGHGRVVFIASAVAAMPMRRFPRFSVAMAGAFSTMRTLAMAHGPKVLVNAVGVGAVGEPLVAGDAAMLGHASVKRAGTIGEAVAAALFFLDPMNTYTSGQMLAVDGGWQAGYGRSF